MIIDNDYSFIGSDIRKIREAKGITRKEIAENMYVSEETIRRIEKGENDPRISTLVPICNYIGIDIKDLINDR
ncbi:helix-turn-helix domain-containing protein [Anaerococcus martiniensis]